MTIVSMVTSIVFNIVAFNIIYYSIIYLLFHFYYYYIFTQLHLFRYVPTAVTCIILYVLLYYVI